jgi:hypothetical protein
MSEDVEEEGSSEEEGDEGGTCTCGNHGSLPPPPVVSVVVMPSVPTLESTLRSWRQNPLAATAGGARRTRALGTTGVEHGASPPPDHISLDALARVLQAFGATTRAAPSQVATAERRAPRGTRGSLSSTSTPPRR